jgi:hypothetical protein
MSERKPTRAWLLAEVARLRVLNAALCRAPKGRKRGQSALLVEIAPSTLDGGIQILAADAQGNEMREMRAVAAVMEKIAKDFGMRMRPVTYDPGPDIPPPPGKEEPHA